MGENVNNIVVSAINFSEGGPLSILKDCLNYLAKNMSDKYAIIALVHRKDLIGVPGIIYYEFPNSKKSWLKRLYYEYIYFKKLSKIIKPYLWLSLHDITPNVQADIRAVYCHNPAPFYKVSFQECLLEPKFFLFNLLYKYLYWINIRKNNYVIVQQSWLRNRFKKLFGIENIIVAPPEISLKSFSLVSPSKNSKRRFFYPTLPRVFKNIEIICEAARSLDNRGVNIFEVLLTIDGTESKYSRFIYNKYKDVSSLRFIGAQTREKIFEFYKNVDCMIFPSKIETWGIPITEFKNFRKPILLANLAYAHEVIGTYDKVKFFDPNNSLQLSNLMSEFMENRLVFEEVKRRNIESPFASNWKGLFDIALSAKKSKCA